MGRKASVLCHCVTSIILVTTCPYKNQGKIAMEHQLCLSLHPFQVFHFIPQELLANTDLSMCAELTLQPLLTVMPPKTPLFSPKKTLTFTLHCHLLCQVKQRTCSFNALAVPCRDFHLLYIKSKTTMNLSKS